MSEESQQLSVAELLARNGQSGAASGGGRRRRAGRGISVADLAGDIRSGGGRRSAHSAPDNDDDASSSHRTDSDHDADAAGGYGATGIGGEVSSGYGTPGTDSARGSHAAPGTDGNRGPTGLYDLPDSGMSPMSGPIARYDPLAPYPSDSTEQSGEPSTRSRRSRYRDGEFDSVPQAFTPEYFGIESYGSADDGSRPGGRRRRRADPDDDLDEYGATEFDADGWEGAAEAPVPWETGPPEPPGGGRAARRRAAEAAEAAQDDSGFGPEPGPVDPPPPAYGSDPDGADEPWTPGFGPESDPRPALPRRRRADTPPPLDSEPPHWPAHDGRLDAPVDEPSGRFESEPTAAWSMEDHGQQLIAGDTVAGELLREQAGRIGPGRGPRGRGGGPVPAVVDEDPDLLDADFAESGYPDTYATEVLGRPGRRRIHDDDSGEFDLDSFEDTGTGRFGRVSQAMSSWNDRFAVTRSKLTNRSESRQVASDDTRRQWLVLGGQSLGAAIAGMLLFKGFEQMWEMLPWVALALAMVVILGLVALVRILRGTDDILSTVIAVFVGVFVTLGPLAFLLSTG
ncbi:hypothetical protein [Nocardia brevicatena]|uniref:hypothetical protein n=1 Tax=Nocardia brevicatena TaxID=37327 RepID=UPI000306B5FE|nr:hypothetical protein [Nocardia brevicatena]